MVRHQGFSIPIFLGSWAVDMPKYLGRWAEEDVKILSLA